MRGHQWASTEGTIVDVSSRRHEHTYTIEAHNGRGVHIRGMVRHKSPAAYPVGSRVRIEIDEHNQMRFDANSPGGDPLIAVMSMSDQIAEAAAAFDNPWAASGPDFGTPPGLEIRTSGGATIRIGSGANIRLGGAAGGFSGLADGLAGLASASGGTTAHVIGPDGQPVPLDSAEIARLTQAMLSGDPAAKQAAIERLHEIKSAATGQGTATPGPEAGPSAEQRLAALDHLLNKGMVTQSEYETQRQRIIESI